MFLEECWQRHSVSKSDNLSSICVAKIHVTPLPSLLLTNNIHNPIGARGKCHRLVQVFEQITGAVVFFWGRKSVQEIYKARVNCQCRYYYSKLKKKSKRPCGCLWNQSEKIVKHHLSWMPTSLEIMNSPSSARSSGDVKPFITWHVEVVRLDTCQRPQEGFIWQTQGLASLWANRTLKWSASCISRVEFACNMLHYTCKAFFLPLYSGCESPFPPVKYRENKTVQPVSIAKQKASEQH